ncbi:MAG: DUF4058 family protein [Gemmataceae bacterium]
MNAAAGRWYDAVITRGHDAMPLHDHFHPPLSQRRPWTTFHGDWITVMSHRLNDAVLPERYIALSRVHLGSVVEVDFGAFEEPLPPHARKQVGNGPVATAVHAWAPPAPQLSTEANFTAVDELEIQVVREAGESKLVAAIELVSPRNKDRPEARRTFCAKCVTYLAAGVSLIVIDVVTERLANLHHELVDALSLPPPFHWEPAENLYAVAYRVANDGKRIQLDAWPYSLTIGAELPTVPLWLTADHCVPLELELTYSTLCRSLRLP